jgi:heptosyltransferase II
MSETRFDLNLKTKASRKSALLLKFGQIGDVIMAIPAAHALYEQGFDIYWVCGKAALPLLECYSWISPIPVDDRAILRGGIVERFINIARLWSRLIPKKYDICATLYYDHRFRLLMLPIRARRKVALSNQSRQTILLAGRHHTDEYVRVLLGIKDGYREHSACPIRPDRLPPSPWSESSAPRRIAIFPGGTSNVLGEQILRRWPVESYVALAGQLIGRGWEIVLLGGPEDAWVKPYFEQLTVTDCIGKLSLPEVILACDACDAVITHDTGPLHMAGLSSTCLVGIFGPTDPATRVPRRPLAVGIWGGQGFACRPCYDGRDFAPCHFNGCMHQVIPELVLRELDQLLSDRSLGTLSPWRIVYPDGNSLPDAKTLVVLG